MPCRYIFQGFFVSSMALVILTFGIPGASAASCGEEYQRPCKVWERVPSCRDGLREDFVNGRCMKPVAAMKLRNCPTFAFKCGTGQSFRIGKCGPLCDTACGPSPNQCADTYQKWYERRNGCDPYGRVDGCSIPAEHAKTLRNFSAMFKPACDQHDVAYSVRGTSKRTADLLFLDDMIAICHYAYGIDVRDGLLNGCKIAANVFYRAVVKDGGKGYEDNQKWAKKNCK